VKVLKIKLIVAGVMALFVIAPTAYAGRNLPATGTQKPTIDWSWTTEEWTGNSQPYQQIQTEVQKLSEKKQLTNEVLQKQKVAAHQKPSDPQAQFRWGYAAWSVAAATPDLIERARLLKGVANALDLASSPRTYEYARLRFIMEAREAPFNELKRVGQRLVERNANDHYVKYYLVAVLDPGKSAT